MFPRVKRKTCLVVTLILFVLLTAAGCRKTPPKQASQNAAPETEPNAFLISGSGSNIPIMCKLIQAYQTKHPDVKIEPPQAVGSKGAIKGVIEGGLQLGLASRDLTAEEKSSGIKLLPYCKVGLILGVHPAVPDDDLSYQEYADIVKGVKNKWQDGSEIIVLTREDGDSTQVLLEGYIPGLQEAHDEALKNNKWQVLHSDPEMSDTLAKTHCAIGYTDTGFLNCDRLPIKPLKLNGIAPTLENIKQGKYKLIKINSLVYKEPVSQQVQDFLDFIFSTEGQRILEQNGYIPIPR